MERGLKAVRVESAPMKALNIFWKKVRRDELSREEALLAARLLQIAEVELLPTRSLLESAARIAIELDHPAYDCLYLALAVRCAASSLRLASAFHAKSATVAKDSCAIRLSL